MRNREPRVVVSFHTTDCAMATERICRQKGLEGRLISVPRSITSDCGIAWSAPQALRPILEELLAASAIETAGYHDLIL